MRYIIEGADREYGGVIRVELDLSEVQTVRDARAWAQAHGIVVRSAIPLTRRQQARIQSKQRRSERHVFDIRQPWMIASLVVVLVMFLFPTVVSGGGIGGRDMGVAFLPQLMWGGDFLLPLSRGAHLGSPFGGRIRWDFFFSGAFVWSGVCLVSHLIISKILFWREEDRQASLIS